MPVRTNEVPQNQEVVTLTANKVLDLPLASTIFLRGAAAYTFKLPFSLADDARTMPAKIGVELTGTSATQYATSSKVRQHAGDGVTPLRRGHQRSYDSELINDSGYPQTIDKTNLINRNANVAIPDKHGARVRYVDGWTGSVGNVTTNKQPGGWVVELIGVVETSA